MKIGLRSKGTWRAKGGCRDNNNNNNSSSKTAINNIKTKMFSWMEEDKK